LTKNRSIIESRAGSSILTNTWLARVANTLESEDCGQDFARVGPLDVENWHCEEEWARNWSRTEAKMVAA